MKLDNFIKFLKLSHLFNSTRRSIYATGEDRMENDSEHSYQLALATWYVIESEKLNLDMNLAIKYALIHDLEEAIYGDIFIFDKKGRKNKERKEKMAREKIIKMFPEWKEYKSLSTNYKLLLDQESRLVNGLDKILPVLNIYLDKGRTWKEEGRSLSEIIENKRKTTNIHKLTDSLWREVEKKLTINESKLFKKK